jgi:putative flippase GtrA
MARYVLVGGVAFVVDFGVLVALTELAGLHYRVSAAIAFLAGLVVNYVIAILWVFDRSRLADRRLEFVIYGIIGIIGVGLNDLVLYLVATVAGVHYTLAKLVSAAIVLQFNFFSRRLILFSRSEE